MIDAALRFADSADLPRLHALMRLAFAEYAPALGYAPQPMAQDYKPWVKQNLAMVLDDDADLLAGAAVVRPRPGYLYLDALAVHPVRRRRGDGRRLMAAVEDLASELCFERVRLHTPPVLSAPMRFYRRLGYREINRSGKGPEARALLEKPIESALTRLLDVGGG
ncbi:MAG: GNAT family N-acetyltransferase [Rhodobacteraceae bacterium]|nr:GNAT family N-acetyltransferase [Paracoccaceae bacterium]